MTQIDIIMRTMSDGRIIIIEQEKRIKCGRVFRVATPIRVDSRTGKRINKLEAAS